MQKNGPLCHQFFRSCVADYETNAFQNTLGLDIITIINQTDSDQSSLQMKHYVTLAVKSRLKSRNLILR